MVCFFYSLTFGGFAGLASYLAVFLHDQYGLSKVQAGDCTTAATTLPPLSAVLPALVLAMSMLGMGNGAVFQLVPQRFPACVGIMTGIIGAAGGFGGFLLPSMLGIVKERTGSCGMGFAILSLAVLVGMCSLGSSAACGAAHGRRKPPYAPEFKS